MWKSRPLLACVLAVLAVPVLTVAWAYFTLLLPATVLTGSLNFALPLFCLIAWAAIFHFLRSTPWPLPLRLVAWVLSAPLIVTSGFVALMILLWDVK